MEKPLNPADFPLWEGKAYPVDENAERVQQILDRLHYPCNKKEVRRAVDSILKLRK